LLLVCFFLVAFNLICGPATAQPDGPDSHHSATLRAEWNQLKQSHYAAWVDGDLKDAIRQVQRLIEIEASFFGTDGEALAVRHRFLADCFVERGDYRQAQQHVDLAVDILKKHSVPNTWQAAESEWLPSYYQQVTSMDRTLLNEFIDLRRHHDQCLETGDFAGALTSAEQLASSVKTLFGERHPVWFDALTQVVYCQIGLGRLDVASVQLDRLSIELQQIATPNDQRTAVVSWLNAMLESAKGDIAACQRYSVDSVKQFEKSGATYHPLYGQALGLHASVLMINGRVSESLEPLRKAYQVSLNESLAGSGQTESIAATLCGVLQQVATDELFNNSQDAATRLCREAEAMAEYHWGANDYRTIDIRNDREVCEAAAEWSDAEFRQYQELEQLRNTATVHLQRNEYSQCHDVSQRCYEGFDSLLGSDNVRTRLSYSRMLVSRLRLVGDPDRWQALRKEAVAFALKLEKSLTPNHPECADIWSRISRSVPSGDADRIRFARWAVNAYKNSYTQQSDQYVKALSDLGSYLADDLAPEAESVLSDALSLWQGRSSANSYQHGLTAYRLANYYYQTDMPYEAAKHCVDAVQIFLNVRDWHGSEPLYALNMLGNVYSDIGDYDEALVHYRKAVQLLQQSGEEWDRKGPFESVYRWLLYNTARSCFETDQHDEAQELLQRLIGRFPDGVNSGHDAYISACHLLSRVYLKQGRIQDAQSIVSQSGYAVELHYRDGSESATMRALQKVEEARVAIAKQEDDNALKLLDSAYGEYQRQGTMPDALSPYELNMLTLYIDRLLELYQQVHAWEKIVEIREFLVPLCAITLREQWPHLYRLEEHRLDVARVLAKADQQSRNSYMQLIEQIHQFKRWQKDDYLAVDDVDLQSTAALQDSVRSLLGNFNLPSAQYSDLLAGYWERRQDLARAKELQQYAVTAYESILGSEDPLTANARVRLGQLLRRTGRYNDAIDILKHGLKDLEAVQGPYHRDTLLAQLELARMYLDVQDYASALPNARAAADTYGDIWGTNNTNYAEAAEVLGFVYLGMNERRLASKYIEQAADLSTALLESGDRRVLRCAANRAVAATWSNQTPANAFQLFNDAISGYEQAGQTEQVDFIDLLVHYGDYLRDQNKIADAEAVYRRAGSAVPDLDGHGADVLKAAIAFRLGVTQRRLGHPADAIKSLTTAADIQRVLFGNNSQQLSDTLHQTALCMYLENRTDESQQALEESLQIQQRNLDEVGNLLSEDSLSTMLGGEERRLDLLLSLLLTSPEDQRDAGFAFSWVLQRKGLALDLACRQRSLQKSRLYDSESVQMAERIRVLRQELADLTLLSTEDQTAEQINSQRLDLSSEISRLNSLLSLKIAKHAAADSWEHKSPGEILETLEPDTVFIDFIRINTPRMTDGVPAFEPRYVAFVLSGGAQGSIRFHDLGPAKDVDQVIEDLRDTTRRVPRRLRVSSEAQLEADYRKLSQPLYETLLGFADDKLSTAKTLVVGPDANLSMVPFSALVNSDNEYVIEKLDVSYVSSARDLLRPRAPPGTGTLILSNPNFDADQSLRDQSRQQLKTQSAPRTLITMRGTSSPDEISLRSLRWQQLPGAEDEAADVTRILSDTDFAPVQTFLGNQALEEVLKAARAPRILHLATHGFYLPLQEPLPDAFGSSRTPLTFTSGLGRLRNDRNPLLRSGLVLAGANRINSATPERRDLEDGWVTAQEIASMDFSNTELVVLSACESGLGDLSAGQGVWGIRRAFINAGAHSVLTSLFKVPDDATRELMTSFYESLFTTSDRRSALSEAQRQHIAKRRSQHQAAHPFFWASFVLVGSAN
jgi:CHAT domain-containing protein